MKQQDINQFIEQNITLRESSFFKNDLQKNQNYIAQQINGKNVFVIGGAGTIGSNYIKEILKFYPEKLFIADINENGLTELVRDLRSSDNYNIPENFITYPIDFGNKVFEKIFLNEGPWHVVANFAAHKHVRSEKDEYSIEAMLDNNLFKANKLLKLLDKNKPEHFFCVSTDKASNPVNVMGASKKLMENLIMAYSKNFKISTARFANVAFSNGSLLDGYLQRIYKNQPLSCPSDIKRFFVSPEESGQICLLATFLSKSGEIFFPKFDFNKDQIYFKDITIKFIEALGLKPEICNSEAEAIEKCKISNKLYPVYFFDSNTSGEKPYEEFYTENENPDFNSFESLGKISAEIPDLNTTLDSIENIKSIFESNQIKKADIVSKIKNYLPGFSHIETGKGLDQSM